jgi:hypothetical protein
LGFQPAQRAWHAKVSQQKPASDPSRSDASFIDLHDSKRLRITAIKKREWLERNEKYDSKTKTPEGKNVVLKGYEHEIVRSLVAFE